LKVVALPGSKGPVLHTAIALPIAGVNLVLRALALPEQTRVIGRHLDGVTVRKGRVRVVQALLVLSETARQTVGVLVLVIVPKVRAIKEITMALAPVVRVALAVPVAHHAPTATARRVKVIRVTITVPVLKVPATALAQAARVMVRVPVVPATALAQVALVMVRVPVVPAMALAREGLALRPL
jgi:hypothetical protein